MKNLNNYVLQTWENNKILRKKSSIVTKFDKNLAIFCKTLEQLMFNRDWVWLASPQIWENLRIISTTQRKKNNELRKTTIMINPIIIEKSNNLINSDEACLSLPWISWDVKRSKIITVEFQNIKWQKFTMKYKDFDACIIQHEIDHLDWILFIDKAINIKKLSS